MVLARLSRLFTVVIWGISFPVTKIVLPIVPVEWLLFIRFIIAGIFLGTILAINGSFKLTWRDLKAVTFLVVLQPVAYFLFETYGVKHTSPSNAAILVSLSPILVYISSVFIKMENLTLMKSAGVVIAFIGAYLTIGINEKSSFHALGDILVLGAVMCAVAKTILAKKLLERISPLVITTYQFTLGALFMLPMALTQDTNWIGELNFKIIASIVFLGVFCSGAAFFALHYALAKLSTSETMVMGYLIPVVTIIAQYFLLNTTIKPIQLIAMALIIAGLVMIQISHRNTRQQISPNEELEEECSSF